MRTKAEFHATREMVGMTQAALAKRLGVEVRSVKRWESESAPQQPPQAAWDVLDAALNVQCEVIDYALGKVEQSGATSVRLPYWASADDYAERSTDAALGVALDADSWRMANANSRAIAAILMLDGIAVTWSRNPLGVVAE